MMLETQPIQRPAPLTVSQLTNAIKLSLESTFPLIYLQGEVTNVRFQSSGHIYFSLKDANAVIGAVMFKADASLLKVIPKGGEHVVVKGELTVYPPKGNYQLVIRELTYAGVGELLVKLEELKLKLHQLGWFKPGRKKAIPRFPKRIGVVTSPTGAVIQDILNVLTRRFFGFHLILNPVKVQGEGAAREIAQAIEQFNRFDLVDVMIVGRGGGSLEDLWAFNEEIVAAAIYNSRIPVISAVGHETDHCIADYVADLRAPTPSAAAEIVTAERIQLLDHLRETRKRITHTIQHLIQQNRVRLSVYTKHPALCYPLHAIELRMQKLDDCRSDIQDRMSWILETRKQRLEARSRQADALNPANKMAQFKLRLLAFGRELQGVIDSQIAGHRQTLAYRSASLDQSWQSYFQRKTRSFNPERLRKDLDLIARNSAVNLNKRLAHLAAMLQALDPKNLLKKGYSILFAENPPSVINSVSKLKAGQKAKLLLSDGEAHLTINSITANDA